MWTPTQSTSNRAVVSNFRLDRCIRTLVPRLIVFRPLMLRDHDTLRLKRMILFFYVVPSAMNTPIGAYVRSLTLLRNVSTSLRSRLESRDSDWAAERTCDDAVPVSDAPRCTSAAFVETAWVPWAVCCTLRAISCVAAPCSSTAAAIAEEISESFSIVPEISLMALTESCVAALLAATQAPKLGDQLQRIAEARAAMSWMSASRQIGQDFLMNYSLQCE